MPSRIATEEYSAKKSLLWADFSWDPVEARAVVEISQREGEASDRSTGESAKKEHTLRM